MSAPRVATCTGCGRPLAIYGDDDGTDAVCAACAEADEPVTPTTTPSERTT